MQHPYVAGTADSLGQRVDFPRQLACLVQQ